MAWGAGGGIQRINPDILSVVSESIKCSDSCLLLLPMPSLTLAASVVCSSAAVSNNILGFVPHHVDVANLGCLQLQVSDEGKQHFAMMSFPTVEDNIEISRNKAWIFCNALITPTACCSLSTQEYCQYTVCVHWARPCLLFFN